ncbi:MAG: PqiC family protein [Candidatus Omnitrophota bacterium]
MREIKLRYCTVIIVCLIFTLTLPGCISVPNSPTPRFYTLNAMEEIPPGEKFNIPSDMIIGVGPVKIPEYLNRPQIVTQDKDKMLAFAQFDRWGESLDIGLERLIAENLTAMLSGATLKMFPWNLAIPVSYQVIIEVLQLESELDKDLFFVVQWAVIENEKMVLIKTSEFRRAIDPHSYSGLARTLSAVCASLSNEIAGTLAALPEPKEKST